MPTIHDTYISALLADATYADNLRTGDSGASLEARLSPRMTPTIARFISDNFEVASHIESSDVFASGFDATVWRGLPGTPYAGKIYVSLQGTAGLEDFLTDAQLALTGNAGQQTIDMVNWWLQITTPVGQSARQIGHTVSLATGLLEPAPNVPGTGRISVSELATGIEVNGHSLGGYLAAAFTRLLGTQAHVVQTTTFNSAGFAVGSENAFATLARAIGPGYGRDAFPVPGDPSQLNAFAVHGLNLTTNTWWFSQAGQRVELFNEESASQIPNHFMYKLTDALALADAMSKLDPTLTLQRANALFEGGSSDVAADVERVLDGLRRVLLGANVPWTPPGDVSGSAAPRLLFYSNLKSFTDSDTFIGLRGKLRLDVANGQIGAKARSDFSAMATLLSLSPVVLTGTNASNAAALQSVLQSAWSQEFADWQADKDLSLADRKAGKEIYSDEWIADRARLVNALTLQHERNSTTGLALDVSVPTDKNYEFQFHDIGTGVDVQSLQLLIATSRPAEVLPPQFIAFGDHNAEALDGTDHVLGDHLYAGGGNDTVRGLAGADWLEGNAGDDSLEGGAGDDTLWGGAGVDTLKGGAGVDFLKGGAGHDLYQFADDTWSADTIDDSDGDGEIRVQGLPVLTGANAKRVNATTDVWQTDDERVTYTKIAAGDNQQHLRITVYYDTDGDQQFDAAYGILVRDWQDGELGISLGTQVAPPPEDPHVFQGDFAKKIEGGLYKLDYRGNYEFDGVQANAQDMIRGTTEADSIYGGGGNEASVCSAAVRSRLTHSFGHWSTQLDAASCKEFACAA